MAGHQPLDLGPAGDVGIKAHVHSLWVDRLVPGRHHALLPLLHPYWTSVIVTLSDDEVTLVLLGG
jgi:hypothetical protein